MSMTAVERFFRTPELVQMLAARLLSPDLTRFSRTNRRLHLWAEPLLYKHIMSFTSVPSFNVLASPDSLQALARNALSVRYLYVGFAEIVHLYNCFSAFEQEKEEVKVNRVTAASRQPVDANTAIAAAFCGIPLPPMRKLIRLSVYDQTRFNSRPSPYLPPITTSSLTQLEQMCWMLHMSECLKIIQLHGVLIRHRQDFMTLAKAVVSIPRLENMHIGLRTNDDQTYHFPDPFRAWCTFFFACQPSIRVFEISLPTPSVDGSEDVPGKQEKDGSDGGGRIAEDDSAMPRRQDPLSFLRNLTLPRAEKGMTSMEIRKILEHCPGLRYLRLHDLNPRVLQDDLATTIATCCPLLDDVSLDGFTSTTNRPSFPFQLVSAIQEQQLEKFRWNPSRQVLRGPEASDMSSRHSRSLRKIVLGVFCEAESKTLCSILNVCEALEELSVQYGHSGYVHNFMPVAYVKLDDLVLKPWACTRLRHMDLSFGIPILHPAPGQLPYYKRTLADTYPDEERQLFAMLEHLYRQIGALTQLSHLRLKAFQCGSQALLPMGYYAKNTFPAMLSLGDADGSGRPGYLECFGGLTKLQRLRGSVYANTDETKVTMSWCEARWMASHWPNLEAAEFFSKEEEATEPFLWLKSQYKVGQLALKGGIF